MVSRLQRIFEDTVLTVWTISGDAFILVVGNEDGRDEEFAAELHRRIRSSKTR